MATNCPMEKEPCSVPLFGDLLPFCFQKEVKRGEFLINGYFAENNVADWYIEEEEEKLCLFVRV